MLLVEKALYKRWGLELEGMVRAIEISVDFTPKQPSPDDRTRLLTVLQRHHYPPEGMLVRDREKPRFISEADGRRPQYLFPKARRKDDAEHLAVTIESDREPLGDATYYVGQVGGRVMIRLMDKVIDKQNKDAGKCETLSEGERRVRIEATLETDELREELGIRFIRDMRSFRFEGLRSRCFNFVLPTFKRERPSIMGEVDEFLERNRRKKFLKVGMIGLRQMDKALDVRRAKHRPSMIKQLRLRGIDVQAKSRRAQGPARSYVAFDELNDAVEVGLRNLREREVRKVESLGL